MSYPVVVRVDPRFEGKSRLRALFRPILAIPHVILVGPAIRLSASEKAPGLLASVAYFLGIVSWFSILFTGRHPEGIREFCKYYLRWRTRALAYMTLAADVYPPFGDGAYPATIEVADPPDPRDRWSIALRLVLAIPHILIVAVLLVALLVLSIVAWVCVVLTARYPRPVFDPTYAIMRWALRVEAYLLLLVDEYPPFAFE